MMTSPLDPGALLRLADHQHTQHRAGACAHPLALSGTRLVVEADTGRVLHRLDTTEEHTADGLDPAGLTVTTRCRNRRASVCPACSALYKLDAYHLVVAGLRGGKSVPDTVAHHPRLFVTITAPSFGPVHSGPTADGTPRPCHPDRGCDRWHAATDVMVGTAVDPSGYDYPGQVLFNAHAGALWATFATTVRRNLATAAGLTRREAARQVAVVFAKVAEFQRRGVVHFHAVVRVDSASGPTTPPPGWATIALLRRAIRRAVRTTTAATAASPRVRSRMLRFGRQIDIRPITTAPGLSDVVVARYVAKYATKSAEAAGLGIPPVCCRACDGAAVTVGSRLCRSCGGTGRRRGVRLDELTDHARALVETCWRLGGLPAFAPLRLRRYAHQAGYRGHFCTKSRGYSTTFAALRAERRQWADRQLVDRLDLPADVPLVIENYWRYQGRAPARGR
jgi:hypothetical protein